MVEVHDRQEEERRRCFITRLNCERNARAMVSRIVCMHCVVYDANDITQIVLFSAISGCALRFSNFQ